PSRSCRRPPSPPTSVSAASAGTSSTGSTSATTPRSSAAPPWSPCWRCSPSACSGPPDAWPSPPEYAAADDDAPPASDAGIPPPPGTPGRENRDQDVLDGP